MRFAQLCLPAFMIMSMTAYAVSPIGDASDGLISIRSNYDVKTTADRLISTLGKKNMTLFARIDHSEGAKKVGETLRPTELIIFGNPKVGTPLMQCEQRAAIDLPQKALIWEDAKGIVWFSYNDPSYISQRHHIKNCTQLINNISNALLAFSKAATAP